MASRIIETEGIGYEITSLIKRSVSRIRLVSPFLELKYWKHMQDAITDAPARRVDTALIYRREERTKYAPLIDSFLKAGVRVYDWERLHAKLYLGDDACIITSMNLDASSANSSEEFAMFSDEPAVVREIAKYVESLFSSSKAEQLRPKGLLQKITAKVADAALNYRPGTCIRCKTQVEFNPAKPLCIDCYRVWSKRGSNVNDPEKYCHSCAKLSKTSVRKPVCEPCFAKGY